MPEGIWTRSQKRVVPHHFLSTFRCIQCPDGCSVVEDVLFGLEHLYINPGWMLKHSFWSFIQQGFLKAPDFTSFSFTFHNQTAVDSSGGWGFTSYSVRFSARSQSKPDFKQNFETVWIHLDLFAICLKNIWVKWTIFQQTRITWPEKGRILTSSSPF